jgi:hypothetical protein
MSHNRPKVSRIQSLSSVADGTVRSFVSRNNDVDGWWALGLLLAATDPAEPDYGIDLLSGRTTPEKLSGALDELGMAWAAYFDWSLSRHRVARERVTRADLALSFDRDTRVGAWPLGSHDRPFVCRVAIEDVRGRQYRATAAGHCGLLDDFRDEPPPARPMRSASRGVRRLSTIE